MRKFSQKDILLLAGLLLAGGLIALGLLLASAGGTSAVVRVDGTEVARFRLDEDREYRIQGADGENLLIIRDGEAWVEEASCPDGLCIGMGHIRKVGQSIICLPNKVVIEIVGDASDSIDEIVK